MTKYIVVSGGIISGIGKGVISSSIGFILKAYGLKVTAIKIDPYLNIDAGTFSPYEHGECFVLDDGGEVDLDLGNYERFVNITLGRENNITTGKIYKNVIERERKGEYLGKTVQVIPHITNEIQEWIERAAKNPVDESGEQPEVCVIELGGIVSDIESAPFVEALRQFQFRVGQENFCNLHVSLLPEVGATGEQKTKPTQASVRGLRGLGLIPDLLVCRSKSPMQSGLREKLSMFCHVAPEQVIALHDCSSIYAVPSLLLEQNLGNFLFDKLKMTHVSRDLDQSVLYQNWVSLTNKISSMHETVNVAIVGKYTEMKDSYHSIIKALQHSAYYCDRNINMSWIEAEHLEKKQMTVDPKKYHSAWSQLGTAKSILVPGGFGDRGVEGMILAANYARINKVPYLGICLGMQVAVIEYARNILNWETANSTEFDPVSKHPVVYFMPEVSKTHMGGTMRLGKRKTVFNSDSCMTKKLYGGHNEVYERHRHRYEVVPEVVDELEAKGLNFVGRDETGKRMEILELSTDVHPYYVGVQYHPEYITRPLRPSPVFVGLIQAAMGKITPYLASL